MQSDVIASKYNERSNLLFSTPLTLPSPRWERERQ